MKTRELFLDTTSSTMDEAKAILSQENCSQDLDLVMVSCEMQTEGKGTRGRAWLGERGNLFVTFGINRNLLNSERIALFPLEFGLLIWNSVAHIIPEINRGQLFLKWPNDLLLQGGKAAGILMESSGNFLLVGLGINFVTAPALFDGGTKTTCLGQVGIEAQAKPTLIQTLYQNLQQMLEQPTTENLLLEWQSKVDWNQTYRLRDREGQPVVKPVSINRQGHLQVEHSDGFRELLISDYLI